MADTKKVSLSFKLGLLSLAIMCTVILVMEVVSYTAAKDLAANSATEKAKGDLATSEALINQWCPGPWKLEGDKLYKGDIVMNDNFAIVDELGQLTNDTITIFMNDTRIATNVKNPDGSRAVGTQASAEVATTVLKGGQPFYGEANVVGQIYQTAYKPIQDNNGNIIGMLYAGAPKEMLTAQINTARNLAVVAGVVMLLIGSFILMYFTKRIIIYPLKSLVEGVNNYAQGDFSQRINIKSADEIGELSSCLNNMSAQLGTLIKDVIDNSQSVAAHSEELAASSEEISASMEEVASTTSDVAATADKDYQDAQAAVAEAQNVAQVAQNGNDTVKQTVEKIYSIAGNTKEVGTAVKNLGELSNKIGNITTVINGIAEQTNLLALNAAIEAARAGESGKGFAVVAEEVRKLAEQSANATDEITVLIKQVQSGVEKAHSAMEQSVVEVEAGVQLAKKSGQALEDINGAIFNTIELIEKIAEDVKQTSGGMEQVASSNEQVTSTIQQMTAAAQELAEIANGLQTAVEQFKI
ncbi:methyl-accepting chemotaxis protein [Peptococcaceae bacterium 1198_IL3148]